MTSPVARVRLKPVALPAEHGSWGFLLEPTVLGILAAPSVAGLLLVVSTAAAFLLRNPARVFLRARRRPAASPRFAAARNMAATYAAVATVSLAGAVAIAGWVPLAPLAIVSPLGLSYLLYDRRNRGRSLEAELFGGLGTSGAAPAIALAAGLPASASAVLGGLVVAKAVPTVLYVRARLRLEDGEPVRRWPPLLAHAAGLAGVAALAWWTGAPWLAVAAMAVVTLRAAVGLSRWRTPSPPKRVGILEFVYSGAYVVATAAGWHLGW